MITIHRQLKYVIFFALGLFLGSTAFASAYTYERTPLGDTQQVTISWTATDIEEFCPSFTQSADQYRIAIFDLVNSYGSAISSPWYSPTTLSGSYTFTAPSDYIVKYVYTTCDYGGNVSEANTIFESNAGGLFTLLAYTAPTTTPTVAGAFSFVDFNDITPTDMLASVRQGTIDTADKTLPLLVFLGIPLGFLLVLFLINLINQTLTPETTAKRGNGRGWTAHGAMEHDLTEFKKKERSRIKRNL